MTEQQFVYVDESGNVFLNLDSTLRPVSSEAAQSLFGTKVPTIERTKRTDLPYYPPTGKAVPENAKLYNIRGNVFYFEDLQNGNTGRWLASPKSLIAFKPDAQPQPPPTGPNPNQNLASTYSEGLPISYATLAKTAYVYQKHVNGQPSKDWYYFVGGSQIISPIERGIHYPVDKSVVLRTFETKPTINVKFDNLPLAPAKPTQNVPEGELYTLPPVPKGDFGGNGNYVIVRP